MKKLKNPNGSNFFISDMGVTVPASGEVVVDPYQYDLLQRSSDVIIAIVNGDLVFNDGSSDITDISEVTRIIQSGIASISIYREPPFAAKVVDGKSLFNRTKGVSYAVGAGSNDLIYSIPWNLAKFNGVEVVNAEVGDYVDLYVLDTPTGTISTIPNYTLNQFGYTVYPASGYYERQSNYDADLIKDLQIKMVYNSVSAKTVYVNYIIHELKV